MESQSRAVTIDGPTHYKDFGGSGTPIVMVHGLGGSHGNWTSVGGRLASFARVAAVDLPGFGFTPPAGRSASVKAQCGIVERFIDEIGAPAVLMGNSMGGLISMLVADASPDRVSAMVLVNPALPPVERSFDLLVAQRLLLPVLPAVGPAWLRRYYANRTPQEVVEESYRMVAADPSRVDHEHRAEAVEIARRRMSMPWAANAFGEASRSIARILVRRREFERMLQRLIPPTLLVHGELDKVVQPASARWAASVRPDWRFEMLPGVGHVPQIEVPDQFLGLVTDFLSSLGLTAIDAAGG